MSTIESVLGPLETSKLGFTLSHEHIVVSSAGIPQIYPEFIQRDESIAEAIKVLTHAKTEGLDSIIDVTTLDLGRDIHMLEQVSKESGVNIICATGTWRDIPRAFWNAPIGKVADLYKREISTGIEDTNIKAGIIKVANDTGGVTREGEIILRAAARAQKETGVPISTHTWAPDRVGEQQVRIFEDEIGKMNRSITDTRGSILAVSQFTLAADTTRGNRPGFSAGADFVSAERMYEHFISKIINLGLPTETGRFRTNMQIALVNDGPVTIWIDTASR